MRKVVFYNASSLPVSYFVQTYSPEICYALEKLSSTATNACRVRRSSDNAETDIGFVGNDLDTATLLAFAGAGSAFVTRMYNQGVAGFDAWNTTASTQPVIVTAGVLSEKNGKPSLSSTTGAHALNINNQTITGPQIETEIAIGSTDNFSLGIVQYMTYQSTAGNSGILVGGDPGNYFGFGRFYNGIYVDSAIKNTNQVILSSEHNGSAPRLASFFVNGNNEQNNTDIGAQRMTTARIMIGAFGGLIGHLQCYISFAASQKALIPTMTTELNDIYGSY